MGRLPFDPAFDELPGELAIFPLPGALLLPGGRLPLNIFEPRYVAMVQDAMAGSRMIGMIQPNQAGVEVGSARTFAVGCSGRIIEYSETDDGRLLITLSGVARFRIAEELPKTPADYRRVRPDFADFRSDLDSAAGTINRSELEAALTDFFQRAGLQADWEQIRKAEDESLITTLSMLVPFEPSEKQALLEASDLTARAATLVALLKLATPNQNSDSRPN